MKTTNSFLGRKKMPPWRWAFLPGLCLAASGAVGAETNAPAAAVPEPLTPEQKFEGGSESYTNWIDFSTGGFFVNGNKSQFQQSQQKSRTFGGIEDLHYEGKVNKDTTFSVDGHGIFDEDNYKLKLALEKEKVGYLRFSIDQNRTWYNGDGGFFAPTDSYFPLSGGVLGLDRQAITFEGGLTLEDKPKVTFKYTHSEREGQKSSTSWGSASLEDGNTFRSIIPSFYDINEHSDSIALDVTHTIKKTDFGAGVRYENGKLDDALNISQFPGDQKTTDRQGTSYDMFSAHAFSETWLKKNLMFSMGGAYSDLDTTLSGSRIYGTDFGLGNLSGTDFGYMGLNGGSRLDEYIANLNLLYKPKPAFSIIPSLRIQKEESKSDVAGEETLGALSTPFTANSVQSFLDVRERLDLRFTGITNWVFYGRSELAERNGDKTVLGGLGPINNNRTGPGPIQQASDDNSLAQKYTLGARWYPLRRLSVDAGVYYKRTTYDYANTVDSTPNDFSEGFVYPAFIEMQSFDTYDGNLRLTYRPLQNLSFISRYEYQYSTIATKPDSISDLAEIETSRMNTHIIGEDATWSPWSRLYFQGGLSYVLSETKTPGLDQAADITQAILDAQNNYWTLNASSGLSINEKTDLNLSYVYYLADNYTDNSIAGVPYGAGAEEHGITTTLTRRIRKNLILSLKYGYFHYNDATFGGNQDYSAHLIYSSLRYRF